MSYRRSAVVILGCIRDFNSSCSLSSFVSSCEVGNPGATNTPAVSGQEGAKQVGEAGRRQQINPTCCKKDPLKQNDAAGAASP